jgi:hypothetical protein
MDEDMRLEEPVVGQNAIGSHVTYHIYHSAGGRSGLQNLGIVLHTYVAG